MRSPGAGMVFLGPGPKTLHRFNVPCFGVPGSLRYIFLLCLLVAAGLSGCASVAPRSDPQLVGHRESGVASFYAMKFQFRKTASGERFSHLALTAAHRTLPFGTRVKVTNAANNRSVIVKINDRGPFVKGRIIDLTRRAFSRIADTRSGVIEVTIEVIR